MAADLFGANASAHEREAQVMHRAVLVRTQNPAALPPLPAVAAARTAYREGPLVPDALQIIARDLARTDADRTFALLQEANRLSRRSTGISIDLLAAYGQRHQDAAGLNVLDQLLRRQTAGHGQLLEAMSGLVANEAMHKPMLQLLAGDPPWAAQFWRQLAQSPAGLTRAADLRLRARQNGISTVREVDQLLVEGLAGQKRFDDAARVAEAIFPAQATSAALLRDSRFANEAGVLPFAWRLFNEGDYGAAFVEGGGLAVDALAGARGTVAEQLVRLPSGSVRLTATVAGEGSPGHLLLKLACVEGAEQVLFEGLPSRFPATISTDGCRWAMLRIGVAIPSGGQASDWLVRQVSLSSMR